MSDLNYNDSVYFDTAEERNRVLTHLHDSGILIGEVSWSERNDYDNFECYPYLRWNGSKVVTSSVRLIKELITFNDFMDGLGFDPKPRPTYRGNIIKHHFI
jgi:hypothetical protein